MFTEQAVVREAAQRERREEKSGQREMDFGAKPQSAGLDEERDRQLRRAEVRLAELVARGPIDYEVLQARVLELPLVWSSEVGQIVMQGCRSGLYVVEGMRSRERVPKAGQIVRSAVASVE